MPIHDQSYRHWEGTLKTHTFRWWIITREGLRIILRRKLFLLFILGPAAIQFFVYGAIVYGIDIYGSLFKFDAINPKFFFDFLERQTFFIALICVFGGSGLIADDLKNNALQLYLSKPLTRLDYLAGKFAIVMLLTAFVTIGPGILLFTEHAVLSEGSTFIKQKYWILGSIILYSLLIMLTTGSLILALSSLTRSSRYAAISFIAILIGSPIFSEMLRGILKLQSAVFISYWQNFGILGRRLFGSSGRHPWYLAMLIILGIIGFSIWAMNRKVKGVEIIK